MNTGTTLFMSTLYGLTGTVILAYGQPYYMIAYLLTINLASNAY